MPETMSAADCAAALGMTPDKFYRHRARLEATDKMPAPVNTVGRPRWHRLSFMAWLGRHHPNAFTGRAANDTAPIAAPASDDAWRDYLHRVYQPGRTA